MEQNGNTKKEGLYFMRKKWEIEDEYRKFCRNNKELALQTLRELTLTPTETGKEEQRIAYCVEWMKRQGMETVHTDELGNVIWEYRPEQEKKVLYTAHLETVVLLSKGEVDSKKIRVEFSLEDMDMSEFQDGATYTQIKDYVLEHSGLKVSNLYISQIKRKCGIEVGKNYNLPKSEDSRQPLCPPEKEKAIREAFKYFGMI